MSTPSIVNNNRVADILIIDDESGFHGLMRRLFADSSYQVASANTVVQARDLLREVEFDLIILDLVLSDEIEGMLFLQELKFGAATSAIPVITVTCHLGDEWLARSIELGAADCFRKGFDIRIFKSKANQLIEQRRNAREITTRKTSDGDSSRPAANGARIKGVVLVADDDHEWLDLTRQRLRAEGYKVIHTTNPSRVVALAFKHRPDCIVLDYRFGACNTSDVCDEIQSHTLIKPIPVIVQSAHRALKLKTLYAGADHFVQKSGTPDDLLAAIHVCLRRKEWSAQILRKGDLMLDPQGRTVYHNEKPVATLSDEQFRFLYMLVQDSPKPVARCDAFRKILHWPDAPPESKALDKLAARIKKKLPKCIRDRIASSRGIGWIYQP